MSTGVKDRPWEVLRQFLAAGDLLRLKGFLSELSPAETARAISRLTAQEQRKLLTILEPGDAAYVIKEVSDAQAIDLIEDLSAESAAAIVDEIPSNRQADLLAELDREDAEAILQEMAPEESEDVRRLLRYDPDTAGGLMITEYVAYKETDRVSDVLRDLQSKREKYRDYHVQYLYVVDEGGKLVGVLRMHDLLFADSDAILSTFMLREPLKLRAYSTMEKLRQFFDEHKLFGVPVVNRHDQLVGVVLPRAVKEASLKDANRQYLGLSGIIGGEELRNMPLMLRSGRRFSWLSINIVLNIVAASVIAFTFARA